MISRIIKAEVYVNIPSKPKADMDNTNRGLDNSRYHTKTEFNNCFIIYSKARKKAKPLFTLLKIWNFRALFSKQWTAPGLGNHSVQ